MDSNRTSPFQASRRFARGASFLQAKAAWVSGKSRHGLATMLPWIRDHAVSIAVVLALPVAVGAFFWGGSAEEVTHFPDDFIQEPAALPAMEDAPVSSVISDAPITSESTSLVSFNPASAGEFGFPQPIPTAEASGFSMNQASSLPGTFPDDRLENASPPCVWLMGSIEPVEGFGDVPQNASRVHELTMPARY